MLKQFYRRTNTKTNTHPWTVKGASLCSLVQGVIASKRMTSSEKSISQARLCACFCASMRQKAWIKIVPLHLVRLDSTKAAQRRADTRPPHSTLVLSKTCRRWPRMHSLILEDRPLWPLTYSICAAPRPLTPRAGSVVAPPFVTHKAPQWPSHFTDTKTGMTRPRSTPTSLLQLSRLFLKRWWMHTQTFPFFFFWITLH